MLKFQQPMLFVGLGGTGCEVGAQLERRFREEICGPDGTRLSARSSYTRTYLTYELPSFLQFVYADLDGPDLAEKRRTAVPGGGHEIAARKTAQVMTDLVPPKLGNSRDVSESLRNSLGSSVIGWLPPIETDPRRGPLKHGAGQLPTVARAVLFETLRQNPDAATGAITRAIDTINTSGEELASFGTRLERSCSVFVVFSVAGGTGSGLFYDYLHLIGNAMQQRDLVPTIVPLVLLPSAFPVGSGGGRAAELNAGSSLIDLFRLLDSLVSRNQGRYIGPRGRYASTEVRHPGRSVPLEANQVETAYLFGHRSGAARKQDLHRCMVEMMLTLTGAVPQSPDDAEPDDVAQPRYEGIVINRVDIADRAPTGVGRRTVATCAVASMTVPVDELLDIVSSRLLAEGVRFLDDPPAVESNDTEIEKFFTASGLENLLYRHVQNPPPLDRVDGYEAIVRMLGERARAMAEIADSLQARLGEEASKMVVNFDPNAAAGALLERMDIFRLSRVVNGVDTAGTERTRKGVNGMLADRRTSAGGPDQSQTSCPSGRDLPKPKLRRLRFDDDAVQAVLADQDGWYHRRARQQWHRAWDEAHRQWVPTWNQFRDELAKVVQSLRNHVDTEEKRRPGRLAALYSPRVGVAYLLPPGNDQLDEFYQDVRGEFAKTFGRDPTFPANPNPGAILYRVLHGTGWPQVHAEARRGPRHESQRAVEKARELIKGRIDGLNNDPERDPLLPRLGQLLVRASGGPAKVRDADLAQFRNKLAGLLPGDFAPPGEGHLHMIISYPAASDNQGLERFLETEIRIPADRLAGRPEFRHIDAETLSVVLERTSMGITEVPEVRHTIRTWHDAGRQQQPADRLRWRRRLAPDPGYLLISPEDRVHVLHRLLCAVWNGQVKAEGPEPGNPPAIVIDTSKDGVAMRLELNRFAGLSSWGSVLRAYEQWVVTNDDRQAVKLTDRLMNLEPFSLRDGDARPSALFTKLVEIAPDELNAVRKERQRPGRDQSPLLRMLEDFWYVRSTDPATPDGDRYALFHDALQLPFLESDDAVAHNLQQLFEATRNGGPR